MYTAVELRNESLAPPAPHRVQKKEKKEDWYVRMKTAACHVRILLYARIPLKHLSTSSELTGNDMENLSVAATMALRVGNLNATSQTILRADDACLRTCVSYIYIYICIFSQ
jgi:hypothetical protein